MPDNSQSIYILLQAKDLASKSLQKAAQEIKNLDTASSSSVKSTVKLTEEYEKAASGAEGVAKGSKKASKEVFDLSAEYDKASGKVHDLATEYSNITKEYDKTSKEVKDLSHQYDLAIKKYDRAGKEVKQLGKESKKAGKEVKDFGDKTKKTNAPLANFVSSIKSAKVAVGAFAAVIATGLVGRALGGYAASMVNAASTSENYRVRLNRLLGSVSEGNRLFADMSKYASTVAFSYGDIMGSATSLAGVMEGGVDEVKKWIPIIGDLAASSGLTIEETTSNVIRMYSAGAASADLFRDRGILAMLGFQAGVSYSAEATRKQLIEAWESPTSKFRDAAGDLATTWTGIMSMFGDSWMNFQNTVADAGVFNYLKTGLTEVLMLIYKWRDSGAMEVFAGKISKVMIYAIEVLIRMAAQVADIFYGWKLVFKSIGIAFVEMQKLVQLGFKKITDGIVLSANAAAQLLGKIYEMIEPLAKRLKIIPQAALDVGKTATEKIKELAKSTKETSKYFEGMYNSYDKVAKGMKASLNDQLALGSYSERAARFIDKVRDGTEKMAIAMEVASEKAKKMAARAKEASYLAKATSNLARLKADTELALKEVEALYKKNEVTIDKFYDTRLAKAKAIYQAELKLQEENLILAGTKDKDKRLKVEDEIYKIKKKYEAQIIDLEADREQEKKKLAEAVLKAEADVNNKRLKAEAAYQDQRARIAGLEGAGPGAGLQEEFRKEQIALQEKQAAEMTAIQEYNDAQLELLRQRKADEEAINEEALAQEVRMYDLQLAQMHERELQAADQHRRVMEMRMEMASGVAGGTAELFTELYELSGKKSKEFFYIAKAAAIAEATINTAQGITKALAQGGFYGTAMATIVGALGAVQIAKIATQSLAQGGLVHGYSPHAKADNISINATAGEYMQPVSAVRYYGIEAMNAIRSKIVPRELFSGFAMPRIPSSTSRTHYAEGGEIRSSNGRNQANGSTVNITNIAGDETIRRYLDSGEGKDSIVNIIGQKAFEVKQVLANG